MFSSVERDFHDNSAKARESQDCSQKVLELQKKFDVARSQVTFYYLRKISLSQQRKIMRQFLITQVWHPFGSLSDKAVAWYRLQ